MSNIHHMSSTDPAPLITVNITSANGSHDIKVLPDSGTDISASGKEILTHLNEQLRTLMPSDVVPKTVDGIKMFPIGKLPATLCLGDKKYQDDVHIYPNVHGTLISWKACKALQILPSCYPNPISSPTVQEVTLSLSPNPTSVAPLTAHHAMSEFPTVFDKQIRSMQGKQFHISQVCSKAIYGSF